ncbi:MAG: right-handed parallel beta-helix repeat-containing protein, partial [Pseudomonadota bacterium]
ETIDITANYVFNSDVSKTNYRVNHPGAVVEGNDYVIDGNCNTQCVGLTINADNVVVRNLTIKRFDGGVTLKPGVTGVRFENVKVLDNVNHGIYVDRGVSNFICDTCDVSDNGAMGIYLEYNSNGNIIRNSLISKNGFRDKDTGDWVENLKADKKDKREGIAIDASQGNLIDNSMFTGNALTGITMYKNCGERGVTRPWGANYNTVKNSTVRDGIYIASRQDKDLSAWSCSDPYILDGKYVMDEAEFNTIDNVTLENNAVIRIKDDNNIVRSVQGGEVIIASRVREALNLPLVGNDTSNLGNNTVATVN